MSSPSVCRHARVGAGLGENFAQHGQVQLERIAQGQSFSEPGGIDVHDHVDERLDLGRLAGGADVTKRGAQSFQSGLTLSKTLCSPPHIR